MATLKLFLDKRYKYKSGCYPLRVAVNHRGRSAFINIGIELLEEQWDANKLKIVKHPQKVVLMTFATQRLMAYQTVLYKLIESGRVRSMDASSLKNALVNALDPSCARECTFLEYYERAMARRKAERTLEIYRATFNKIKKLIRGADRLTFEDITPDWLRRFDSLMDREGLSRNARNIHLRNIRAIFNDAITDELTSNYPFRKFRIKNEETPKRNISAEDMRLLLGWEELHGQQREYLDMFKLMLCLIGINVVDLLHLKKSDYRNGRITYHRAKTNRFYDIKVEPEADRIIRRYAGDKYLLRIMDRRMDYKQYARQMNYALQHIGRWTKIDGRGGKYQIEPLFPGITTYTARHSWATYASRLDIPKDTIAAALGHGGKTVTDIYIDFDQQKVDEANRRVLDYVLGGG